MKNIILLDEFTFVEGNGLVGFQFVDTVSDETKMFKLTIDTSLLAGDLVDHKTIKSQILMYTLSHEKMTLIVCKDDNDVLVFDAFRTNWNQIKDTEILELKLIAIKL